MYLCLQPELLRMSPLHRSIINNDVVVLKLITDSYVKRKV
jgi:hypothetical protein